MDVLPDQRALPGMDPTVLPALLSRLDPGVAVDLARQFAADLRGLRQMLDTALGPPADLVTLARQAHVLIALAGTAGAGDLAAHARLLLRAAQHGNAGTSVRLVTGILPCIDRLVAFVAACPLPDTRPAL